MGRVSGRCATRSCGHRVTAAIVAFQILNFIDSIHRCFCYRSHLWFVSALQWTTRQATATLATAIEMLGSLGTGGAVIVFYAAATLLAFSARRVYYLNRARMEWEPRGQLDQGHGNDCACPGDRAIAGWVFFDITILNDVFIFVVTFGKIVEASAGVVHPN